MKGYGRATEGDRGGKPYKRMETRGGRPDAGRPEGRSRSNRNAGSQERSGGKPQRGNQSGRNTDYREQNGRRTQTQAYVGPRGAENPGGREQDGGSWYDRGQKVRKPEGRRTSEYAERERRTETGEYAQNEAYAPVFPKDAADLGHIEGRNAVLEAFRSGKTIDRLLIQDGCQDGPIQSIKREAHRQETLVEFVPKERLDRLSETGRHQGVIAFAAAYDYAEVEDILKAAQDKGEQPFLILLDGIEDPHNLGAIIRTANLAGAHGVIIPKRRAVGLTAAVARASAGALNYTPVARVTNLAQTIEELKKQGIWFACAAMDADPMYRADLTGPIGLVIGGEGDGVSRLVREKCDFAVSIPMKGNIDSLNASVAAGVLAYEIVRQREHAEK